MEFSIDTVSSDEYPLIVDVWEASVRATHEFMTEADIAYFKPLILNNYLKELELRVARDSTGEIIGFIGVSHINLELLFVRPDKIRAGVGKKLLKYAVRQLDVRRLDVNEQNVAALNFYTSQGFKITGRSEKDSAGKPYPILYMSLKNWYSKFFF